MVPKYNPEIHHRRSIRLKGHDYSKTGAYFVTVCTQNRECLFGNVIEKEMRLNEAGKMIESIWENLSNQYPGIQEDAFVVMPNHIHGIIVLSDLNRRGESCIRPHSHRHPRSNRIIRNGKGDHKDRPYGTLDRTVGRILQGFKSISTREYISAIRMQGWLPFPGKLWQRNYHERIIRDENELNRIREYIALNPTRWMEDEENPMNLKKTHSSPTFTTIRT